MGEFALVPDDVARNFRRGYFAAVPPPRHNYHNQNYGLTEIHLRFEIPMPTLMARSRYRPRTTTPDWCSTRSSGCSLWTRPSPSSWEIVRAPPPTPIDTSRERRLALSLSLSLSLSPSPLPLSLCSPSGRAAAGECRGWLGLCACVCRGRRLAARRPGRVREKNELRGGHTHTADHPHTAQPAGCVPADSPSSAAGCVLESEAAARAARSHVRS
jgi:hypothetical protein